MGNPIEGWRVLKTMRSQRSLSGERSQGRAENSPGIDEPRQQFRGKMIMLFVGLSIYWRYDGKEVSQFSSRLTLAKKWSEASVKWSEMTTFRSVDFSEYKVDFSDLANSFDFDFDTGLASRMEASISRFNTYSEDTRRAYEDFSKDTRRAYEDFSKDTRRAYEDFRKDLSNDWSDLKTRMSRNIDWSQYTSRMDLSEWTSAKMDLSLFTSRMDLSELADNTRLKELRAKYFTSSSASWSLPSAVNSALPAWAKVTAGWALIDLVVLFILLSVWEANKFPRQVSVETSVDKVRMVAQCVGDLLLAPYFALRPGEVPELRYQKTERNESIIKLCPTLQTFKQMVWLRNAWISFGALMFFDITGAKKELVKREVLRTPDGGSVALDWWAEGPDASIGKKVLFIGSTFVGDALVTVTRDTCRHFTRHGWRCVVMVKRGCGMTMPNALPAVPRPVGDNGAHPRPWCFQGFDDVKLALDHIAQQHPDLPICALGFSTGAGQLRNYVNATGQHCKLSAAVIVDAAPSWEDALVSCERRVPFVGHALACAAEMSFEASGQKNTKGIRLGQKADPRIDPGGLLEFVRDHMAPAHGFEANLSGMYKYLKTCAPANPEGCAVPTLELTTYNDILIDVPLVPVTQQFYRKSPNIVTCVTRGGTHMVRWEGFRLTCWISRAGLEFLEAALKTNNTSAAGPPEPAEAALQQCNVGAAGAAAGTAAGAAAGCAACRTAAVGDEKPQELPTEAVAMAENAENAADTVSTAEAAK